MIIAPCSYVHKEHSEAGLPVDTACITDIEEQFKYLTSSIAMKVLHNSQRLDPKAFRDGKIIEESIIKRM